MQSHSDAKKAQIQAEARERAAFDAQVNAAVGAAMQRNQQVRVQLWSAQDVGMIFHRQGHRL